MELLDMSFFFALTLRYLFQTSKIENLRTFHHIFYIAFSTSVLGKDNKKA